MELIPVPHQIDRKAQLLILDENVQMPRNFKLAPKFINARQVVKPGCPDWILLERAKERNAVIVTRDKGLVIRGLIECQDMIYQTNWNEWYKIFGSKTLLIARGVEHPKCLDNNREKMARIYARFNPLFLHYDGFGKTYCI